MVGDFPRLAPVDISTDLADKHHHDRLLLPAINRGVPLNRAEFVGFFLLLLDVQEHAPGQ